MGAYLCARQGKSFEGLINRFLSGMVNHYKIGFPEVEISGSHPIFTIRQSGCNSYLFRWELAQLFCQHFCLFFIHPVGGRIGIESEEKKKKNNKKQQKHTKKNFHLRQVLKVDNAVFVLE